MTYRDSFEPPEACPCGNPACRCGRCHGVAWAWVSPTYPLEQVPDPPAELLEKLAPEGVAAVERQVELRRRAAAQSVYPCRACNAALFFRWREGHLDSDHERGLCPDCQGVTPRRQRTHA